jgi:hypothetical protein
MKFGNFMRKFIPSVNEGVFFSSGLIKRMDIYGQIEFMEKRIQNALLLKRQKQVLNKLKKQTPQKIYHYV